jgi:CxxC-x17-CxxC domain-containing protein
MSEANHAETSVAAQQTQETEHEFNDLSILCIDCSEHFTWTAGEQAFFAEKSLTNPPKRCKECKKAKNRRLAAIEMAQATGKPHKIEVKAQCAKCYEMTTVPFYPSQGRPVFCRTCFDTMKTGN